MSSSPDLASALPFANLYWCEKTYDMMHKESRVQLDTAGIQPI